MSDNCGDSNDQQGAKSLEVPTPKLPSFSVVSGERFREALELLEIPQPETVCSLAVLKTVGGDSLVLSADHEITVLDGSGPPPNRSLVVNGPLTTIASVPVSGSKCTITRVGSCEILCCPRG
jgi:hypothetical protein